MRKELDPQYLVKIENYYCGSILWYSYVYRNIKVEMFI